MSLVTLKTELRQELKLTPQLLQSMEVLQMNSQELLDYLGKLSEENPTLELSDAPDLRASLAELRQRRPAGWTPAASVPPSPMRRVPRRSRGLRTGNWRACPPSCVTSWSGSGCPDPCWR